MRLAFSCATVFTIAACLGCQRETENALESEPENSSSILAAKDLSAPRENGMDEIRKPYTIPKHKEKQAESTEPGT